MGLIRILLAICVVAGHSSLILGLPFLDAGAAVKAFFVISGFYMALILDRKYDGRTPGGRRLFWSNRFLRIYPPYLATLLFALLFYAAACWYLHRPADRFEYWIQAWQEGHYAAFIPLLFSQFSVIGLDLTPAFGFSHAQGFTLLNAGMLTDTVQAWRFNMLPHAWSISVELLFYLIAPWLCRWGKRGLLGLVLITIGMKGMAGWFLPVQLAEALVYHFMPFQIGYFALGILAYQWRGKLVPSIEYRAISGAAWGLLIGGVVFGGLAITGRSNMRELAPLLMAIGAPSIFALSRNWHFDRMIGELSYSLYLLHVPCKWVLSAVHGSAVKDAVVISGSELLVVSVVASIGMYFVVERPIDRWRERRIQASGVSRGVDAQTQR